MANEARINSSMRITKGTLSYQSQPQNFSANVDEGSGPTPGELLVTAAGKNVDLSALITPGLCRIQNRSDSEFVLVGIHDGTNFYPMLELLPGESYVMRLYREIGVEFTGTGTGTPSDVNQLHLKVTGSTSARVLVEAFGK